MTFICVKKINPNSAIVLPLQILHELITFVNSSHVGGAAELLFQRGEKFSAGVVGRLGESVGAARV